VDHFAFGFTIGTAVSGIALLIGHGIASLFSNRQR
jgi:hypothetical protein